MMYAFGGRFCSLHGAAYILVLIGAINWLLVGIGGFLNRNLNLVNLLLGDFPQIEWLVYILVGISGIAMIFQHTCAACRNPAVVVKK